MRQRILWVIVPIVFASCFVLHLYIVNLGKVRLESVVIAWGGIVVGTLTLLGGIWFLTRDKNKSSFLCTVLVLLFFTYGHVFQAMADPKAKLMLSFINVLGGLHRFLLPLWLILIISAIVFIVKRKDLNVEMHYLSLMAMVLAAMLLVDVASYGFSRLAHSRSFDDDLENMDVHNLSPIDPAMQPDIYYIILDAYARNDTLQEVLGYDNADFIAYLISRGFYVADESHSNYPWTGLSIPSSLRMKYLDDTDNEVLSAQIASPNVARILKASGYRFLYFPSEYSIANHITLADQEYTYTSFNEFDALLLQTTILATGFDIFINPQIKRDSQNYMLDQLAKIPSMPEPTFTFVHLTITHIPYVFNADGSSISPLKSRINSRDSTSLYLDQITYTNRKIKDVVNEILDKSAKPPVIILQADHGPAGEIYSALNYSAEQFETDLAQELWNPKMSQFFDARMGILNAYYLPSVEGRSKLYSDITPVNSFRIILDTYCGTHLGLLEDEFFFTTCKPTCEPLWKIPKVKP